MQTVLHSVVSLWKPPPIRFLTSVVANQSLFLIISNTDNVHIVCTFDQLPPKKEILRPSRESNCRAAVQQTSDSIQTVPICIKSFHSILSRDTRIQFAQSRLISLKSTVIISCHSSVSSFKLSN